MLFNEVPGCGNVLGYAQDVLSNPLVVDAIERHFVPVLVQNNTTGDDDARARARFGEPAWNNPVARIVDVDGHDLVPRVTHDRGALGLAEAMAAALYTSSSPRSSSSSSPSSSLSLLLEEQRGLAHSAEATFGMSCFWEGEAALGAAAGVLETTPGFAAGEAVRVRYDRRRFDPAALPVTLRPVTAPFTPSSTRSDHKHALPSSWTARLGDLDLTPLQATRANALAARGEDPAAVLTQRQRTVLASAP